MPAGVAADPGKASGQVPTAEELLHDPADHWAVETVLLLIARGVARLELGEVGLHALVEGRYRGVPRLVRPRDHSCPRGGGILFTGSAKQGLGVSEAPGHQGRPVSSPRYHLSAFQCTKTCKRHIRHPARAPLPFGWGSCRQDPQRTRTSKSRAMSGGPRRTGRAGLNRPRPRPWGKPEYPPILPLSPPPLRLPIQERWITSLLHPACHRQP